MSDVICLHGGLGRCVESADPVIDQLVDDVYETNIKLPSNIKRTDCIVISEIEFLAIYIYKRFVGNIKPFTQVY